jgi:protoheme IX farnesyltransferase
MRRTRGRPLPAGDLSRAHATIFAAVAGAAGLAVLAAFVNGLAALLALFTVVVYVALYTPLKTRSTLNTLLGAVCGATPPMIGWVGATGALDAGAWSLGALLFVWQIPHFLALAWLYRDDYARGRFAMLPVFDRSGQLTCQIVVLTSLMLIPLALSATLLGLAGWVFTGGSIVLGLWMGARGVRLYRERSNDNARRVFLASLVYLTAILALLVIDRGPLTGPPRVHRVAAAAPTSIAP